ncbi:hypothetical protein F53441_4330 [Fusarium austroafricanum]|uniref:Uncharacterized protein n=1 Tax=Fusarium austroafricanum TaxID=2364996 RepID=A0A8H4KP09_9HYPO|nr:hypothetical protein F53441_4330 [Fusarium austroafricanum]
MTPGIHKVVNRLETQVIAKAFFESFPDIVKSILRKKDLQPTDLLDLPLLDESLCFRGMYLDVIMKDDTDLVQGVYIGSSMAYKGYPGIPGRVAIHERTVALFEVARGKTVATIMAEQIIMLYLSTISWAFPALFDLVYLYGACNAPRPTNSQLLGWKGWKAASKCPDCSYRPSKKEDEEWKERDICGVDAEYTIRMTGREQAASSSLCVVPDRKQTRQDVGARSGYGIGLFVSKTDSSTGVLAAIFAGNRKTRALIKLSNIMMARELEELEKDESFNQLTDEEKLKIFPGFLLHICMGPVATIAQIIREVVDHFPDLVKFVYYSSTSCFAVNIGVKVQKSAEVFRTLRRLNSPNAKLNPEKKKNPDPNKRLKKFTSSSLDADNITTLPPGRRGQTDGDLITYKHQFDTISDIEFDILVCDESQYIRRSLGTPITSSLKDLVSPLSLVSHVDSNIKVLATIARGMVGFVPGLYFDGYDPFRAKTTWETGDATVGIFT